MKIFLSFVLIFVFIGCAPEPKLIIRVKDKERHEPTVDLSRKVEITRYGEEGNLLFHQAFQVANLATPSRISSEEFKGLELGQKGSVVVRAFAEDGLPLLIGHEKTPAEKNKDLLEVTLSRDNGFDQPFSFAIRRFSVANASGLENYHIDPQLLLNAQTRGECVQVPRFFVFPKAAEFPALLIEGNLKAVPLAYDFGVRGEKRQFEPEVSLTDFSKDSSGRAKLAIDRSFRDGAHLKSSQDIIIRIFQKPLGKVSYVGCLGMRTDVQLLPLEMGTQVFWEKLQNYDFRGGRPISVLRITNPNDVEVMADISVYKMTWPTGSRMEGVLYYRIGTNDEIDRHERSHAQEALSQSPKIPPNGLYQIYVLGIHKSDGDFLKQGLKLHWRVKTKVHPNLQAEDFDVREFETNHF